MVGGSAGEDGWLRSFVLRSADGETETVASEGLFLLIGAYPNTDWLPAEIERDDGGFIYTGAEAEARAGRPLERSPLTLETAMPGVFATSATAR